MPFRFFSVGDDIRFQYRLNKGGWSDFTTVRTKEYSSLSEGEYTFEVKAVFPDGTTSSDTIAFRILPPWYRSAVAYVCYIILALLALWYVYRWDDVRVKRKKQQAVVEKDKELHDMEKGVRRGEGSSGKADYAAGRKKNWNTICKHKSRKWPI